MLTSLLLPLPRGISSGASVPEASKIRFSDFKAACEHAAGLLRGKLDDSHDAYARHHFSYHEATISYDFGRKRCRVLCSACYPVIAFATAGPQRDACDFTFIDNEMLKTAVGEKLDAYLLNAEDANRGITKELIELLGEGEKKDVRYWKPRKVGDLIFNHWD